ncbi:hypothetical protein LOAG_15841 [Loa loa]|uniref:Uncharacterized protein n=1 Tax=Loa loa TaxID=7209 RepID=A0A1S0TEY2_LOALO|nr:hypothetical protein LOAG_15841 [Loa loa]EFO12692.1 hypothetical protein LOAG_15841 [Loa loa]
MTKAYDNRYCLKAMQIFSNLSIHDSSFEQYKNGPRYNKYSTSLKIPCEQSTVCKRVTKAQLVACHFDNLEYLGFILYGQINLLAIFNKPLGYLHMNPSWNTFSSVP